jgi:hypothetical protein
MEDEGELFLPRRMSDERREALEEYDRGEWPVRDWSVAVTLRLRGYNDEFIRSVLGYVPRTDVPLKEVIAKGMKAIR